MEAHQITPLDQTQIMLAKVYSSFVEDKLTRVEKRELNDRPIGGDMSELTDEQMDIRWSISKKMFEIMLDKSKPDAMIREVYTKFPPYHFYGEKGCPSIARRSYGAMIREDGTPALHILTAHMLLNNDVIGGVTTDSIVIQDRWTPAQRFIIELSPTPYIFLDPCGWTIIY